MGGVLAAVEAEEDFWTGSLSPLDLVGDPRAPAERNFALEGEDTGVRLSSSSSSPGALAESGMCFDLGGVEGSEAATSEDVSIVEDGVRKIGVPIHRQWF